MKWINVEPLSKEWQMARIGIPTASCFDRIVTPAKLELSKQADRYLRELLAEYITGMPLELIAAEGAEPEQYQSRWMGRGQETEDSIWKCYEAYSGIETERGGFFSTDDGLIGASPDRIVGDAGLLEAKAPGLTTQIGYALTGGAQSEYMLQVQGQLLVSEREWVDVFSWNPRLFVAPVRVYRDERVIAALETHLSAFVGTMLTCREKLEKEFGPFTRPEPVTDNIGALGVTDEDVDSILKAQAKAREV